MRPPSNNQARGRTVDVFGAGLVSLLDRKALRVQNASKVSRYTKPRLAIDEFKVKQVKIWPEATRRQAIELQVELFMGVSMPSFRCLYSMYCIM